MKNQVIEIIGNQFDKVLNGHDVYSSKEVQAILETLSNQVNEIEEADNSRWKDEYFDLKDQVKEFVNDYDMNDFVELELNYNNQIDVEVDTNSFRNEIIDLFNDFEASLGLENNKD